MSLPDIKTLLDRCEEVGDCWVWQQHHNSAGYPACSHAGKNTLVRRRAFELQNGFLPTSRSLGIVNTCPTPKCCNPDHLAVRTRSQIVKRTYATTRCTNVEYGARCAARVRQGVKLSLEIARELRLNERNETAVAAAARLGCSDSLVYKIRQGHIWREAAVNSSVFHQAA